MHTEAVQLSHSPSGLASGWTYLAPLLNLQDVIYYFAPVKDCTVNISLCGSGNTTAPIDSVLYLVADLHSQNIAGVSCNDDFCGRYSQLQVSLQI